MSAPRFAGLALRLSALWFSLTAVVPLPAHAVWKPFAVSRAPGDQVGPKAVRDGAGGAIVIWSDKRSGNWQTYAQRLLAGDSADPAWPTDGLLLPAPANAIVSDGALGAILVGTVEVGGVFSSVRAYHVLASGSLDATWPAGGVVLRSGTTLAAPALAVSDGAGGSVVIWNDERDFATQGQDIYAHRVLSTGVADPAWPVNGRVVYAGAGHQNLDRVVSDGSGGAIVVWEDTRPFIDSDIYAQRVLPTGALGSGWPAGGRVLCADPYGQYSALACSDGAGGAIVFWWDLRNSSYDVYGMRVKADGQLASGWDADGELITDWPFDWKYLWDVVSDGAGGAVLTWFTSSNADLYVQRVNSNGDRLWIGDPDYDPNGVLVCRPFLDQALPVLAPDGSGGVFIGWRDGRFWTDLPHTYYFYLHHVLGNGTPDPTWTPDGTRVSFGPYQHDDFTMVSGAAGSATVIWGDRDKDLFAVNINSTWSPFHRLQTYVVPAGHGTVTVEPDLPSYGQGQTVTLTVVPAPGKTFHSWMQDASGTMNPLSLVMNGSKQVGAVFPDAIVGVDEPELSFGLERISPSPSRGGVEMAYSLPKPAHVRLAVYDLSGRQLTALVDDERPAGHHVVRWDGRDRGALASPGVYFFRFETPQGSFMQRVAIIQ